MLLITRRASVTRAWRRHVLLYMEDADPAELVRSLRSNAGLSQYELAVRAGMAQSAISNYESGRKVPSLTTLARLAEAAGVALDVSFAPVRYPKKVTLASLRRGRAHLGRLAHIADEAVPL